MKIILVIFLFLIISNYSCKTEQVPRAYESKQSLLEEDSMIYTITEEMPRFPGCEDRPTIERRPCSDQKMLQYLYKNLKYNPISKDQVIESTIVATFVIEKNGGVSNIEIKKGKGLTNIIEVIEKMPKWKPGIHEGEPKRVRFNIPIRIHLK